MQYKGGKVDLTNAPSTIKKNCFQIDIDLELFVKNENPDNIIASWDVSIIHVHLYTLSEEEAEPEEFESSEDHNDENQTACESLALPHSTLHTSWDNIILPSPIKSNLLGYAESALLFSQAQVSPHIISWNRLILLYGPPGTGKTSLCRALAHKLAIRTRHIFNQGAFLFEIKSHSLFSKWFSESGFPNFFSEFGKLFRMNLIVYFDEVERGRWQLITVDGYQLQSTVINCSRRQSTAVDGYQLQSTAVDGYQLPSTVSSTVDGFANLTV